MTNSIRMVLQKHSSPSAHLKKKQGNQHFADNLRNRLPCIAQKSVLLNVFKFKFSTLLYRILKYQISKRIIA